MKVLIKGGNAVLPDRICENFNILIQDGKIKKTGNVDECADKVIDVGGMYVCPGFVDIHTHGGGGGDFMDATAESFEKALGFHAKNGTTALLATSVTAPLGQIFDMLCTARKFYGRKNPENSRVLGVHTEGPYLSVKNRGAQKKEYLRIPSENSYDFILKNADIIKSVTISPELNGANELKKCGITVCGGHDDGDRERILPVIKAGMSHCTHLWCAMSEVQMVNGRRSAGLCEIGL